MDFTGKTYRISQWQMEKIPTNLWPLTDDNAETLIEKGLMNEMEVKPAWGCSFYTRTPDGWKEVSNDFDSSDSFGLN